MSYCPLNAGQYGLQSCQERHCTLSDANGNCLVKKYLEVSIEEKEFMLAAKKKKLNEQKEKDLNATRMLN